MSSKPEELTGRELDAAVHAALGYVWPEDRCRVCGWPLKQKSSDGCVTGNCSQRPPPIMRADEPPLYSSNIGTAWSVVLKMREDGFAFTLADQSPFRSGRGTRSGNFYAVFRTHPKQHGVCDPSGPRAICLAALSTLSHSNNQQGTVRQ